jgi:hypothetical protein
MPICWDSHTLRVFGGELMVSKRLTQNPYARGTLPCIYRAEKNDEGIN